MSSQQASTTEPQGIEVYFTDVEELQALFKNLLTTSTLTKRLFIIHGVSGVGKSSLLRMFRLHCKSVRVPVALVSVDEAKSTAHVFYHQTETGDERGWVPDLKADGIALPTFTKTFKHYRAIQAKVNVQTKSKVAELAGKAAAKTAEAAISAAAGALIGSAIPGIGTFAGALSGLSAEALVDWLRSGGFSKPDIDLLLDPAKKLSEDFLSDLAKIAPTKRIVLMLDTYEQMTAFDDWAREIAQRLHSNVLLVIAGHTVPNWSRAWRDWEMQAEVHELKPMNEEDMRVLVRRYYAALRGGEPDPKQVEAIVRFARGLPIVVTSAVQLWVQYGVEDFQTVKPQVLADLVDRLMDGVPSEMIPALEAAATVRWLDQPILRALTGQADVRDAYDELRRFPFVRPRAEGFMLHDAVREMIDENLEVQDSEQHRKLHEHAAEYFENKVGEQRVAPAVDAQRDAFLCEWLYHRIRADEEAGILLFQKMAEELARYSFVGRLRTLMNDVNTYQLASPNGQLWRDYYTARLLHISLRLSEAEKTYIKVSESKLAEPKLRAYALCDLGQIWTRNHRLAEPGGLERSLSAIKQSRQLAPELDSKLALNFSHLRYVYMFKGELDRAVAALRQQHDFCIGIGDRNGTVYSLNMLIDLYGLLGDWKMAADAEKEGLEMLDSMPSDYFLRTRLIGHNIWYKVWSGRYSEAERGMRQALAFAEQEEYIEAFPGLYRDLGLVTGLQRRWEDSEKYFSKSVTEYKELGHLSTGLGAALGFWGSILMRRKEFPKAGAYLTSSLSIKKELHDNNGIPEVLVWMGEMYEMKARQAKGEEQNDYLVQAESYYHQCLDYRWTSRRYFECAALTGLMRVKYSKKAYGDAVNLFAQAEQIAQEYQYHDLVASLYLFKGHIQWLNIVEVRPGGFDAAIQSYEWAMLHALSYNRFLLDEVLWGDQVSTPLIDIISQCSSQGPEGRRILNVLANWWETSIVRVTSDVLGEVLSSEMNNIALTQAERLARQREPGDGAFQPSVIETLNRFLE